MTIRERLNMNVKQVNSDLQDIKSKIIEKGVEIAEGTRTAEYADKVDEVYEKGFADGKASVTINFYADYSIFVAIYGMTWREYINSPFNDEYGSFSIEGDRIIYCNGVGYIDASPDDKIVPDGYYTIFEDFYVRDGDNLYCLKRVDGSGVATFVSSEYNTIGLWIDSDGYLRTATNRYVYAAIIDGNGNFIPDPYGGRIRDGEYYFMTYEHFIAADE